MTMTPSLRPVLSKKAILRVLPVTAVSAGIGLMMSDNRASSSSATPRRRSDGHEPCNNTINTNNHRKEYHHTTNRTTRSLYEKTSFPLNSLSQFQFLVANNGSVDVVSQCDSSSSSSSSSIAISRSEGVRPLRDDGRNFIADAVEKVLHSVCKVEVTAKLTVSATAGKEHNNGRSHDLVPPQQQRGSGSGFLVKTDDILPPHYPDHDRLQNQDSRRRQPESSVMVITNAHCVLTPAEFRASHQDRTQEKHVYLEMPDGRLLSGKIVAFDVELDVAMIEPKHFFYTDEGAEMIDDEGPSSMTLDGPSQHPQTASLLLSSPSEQHNSKTQQQQHPTTVRHGEFVMAIGAPLELENTVTVGIVSNPRRKCRHSKHKRYIQSDVSLHVGSSGGPLVNIDGQVIGINSKKVAEGVAYSIPIEDAVKGLREAYLRQNSTLSCTSATTDEEDATKKNEQESKQTKDATPQHTVIKSSSEAPVSHNSTSNSSRRKRRPSSSATRSATFLKGELQDQISTNAPVLISRRW